MSCLRYWLAGAFVGRLRFCQVSGDSITPGVGGTVPFCPAGIDSYDFAGLIDVSGNLKENLDGNFII